MRTLLPRLALLLSCACALAGLTACGDKHEPTKPTVSARA